MPYTDPEKQREARRRWDRKNVLRKQQAKLERRRLLRKKLAELKRGLKCSRCPETHPACLDFHHRNPRSKSFSLGEAISRRDAGWDAILKEIKKCVVLCANCHRKKHAR